MNNKSQKRHLFLFDGGVLFCKKRSQPLPYSPEFYEHKFCIPVASLGFAECSKQSPDRFELWDENKSDGYTVYTVDEMARKYRIFIIFALIKALNLGAKWIQRLARLTVLSVHHQQKMSNPQSPTKHSAKDVHQSPSSRPHSWTSDSTTASSRSSHSTFDDSGCHHQAEG
jgi:hypothetical protein